MILTQKYKGEPLDFSIEMFADAGETQAINLTGFDDVIAYVYVDRMSKQKFARVKTGYKRFESSSTSFKLDGIVPGSISKTMLTGVVKLEIWTSVNGVEQQISLSEIYYLNDSQIKAES